MKPLILISNDDGIHSPHLEALATAVEEGTGAEVVVVAPERERSAASHTITLHKPLRLRTFGRGRYALSGTPVDCVYVGVLKLAERPPSLVISGINAGYNLGTDVFYSGTVAAAVEGGLRGVSSFAISMDGRSESGVNAGRFAAALASSILAHPMPAKTVLNVNVPPDADGRYEWTHLGERVYADDVTERHDPRGRPYYWIGGGAAGFSEDPGSDCAAVRRGIISVSPLYLDLTHRTAIAEEPQWVVEGHRRVRSGT